MTTRSQDLADLLQEHRLDSLLVTQPENRRYLSGFTGSAGYLLITRDNAILATDARYTEQAQLQAPDFQVMETHGGWEWLFCLGPDLSLGRIGFESQHVTVATYQDWLDRLKGKSALDQISLVATSGLVEQLRQVKTQNELVLLQKAIDASDAAMESVSPTITEGMSEKEIAWRMENAMREFGADATSFNTIVASGPNGAMAHHRPTDRPIRRGEPIVIDMGARVGGYCSDLTRTITVGEPDELFHKVYDIVLGTQLTAIHTLQPGMSGKEGDSLARNIIAAAGYGDNFGHSLGHGVGLAVHESPRLGQNSGDALRPGMVFTVEPGIYISGWGGVRIEDIVLLGEKGATPLSDASK